MSSKDTFESKTFAANTFACGTFRGLGVDSVQAGRIVCFSAYNSKLISITAQGTKTASLKASNEDCDDAS
jgi:hypothetical protein